MIKAEYRVSEATKQALKTTVFRKEIRDPSSRFILTRQIKREPFPHQRDTWTASPLSTRLTHYQGHQKEDL